MTHFRNRDLQKLYETRSRKVPAQYNLFPSPYSIPKEEILLYERKLSN